VFEWGLGFSGERGDGCAPPGSLIWLEERLLLWRHRFIVAATVPCRPQVRPVERSEPVNGCSVPKGEGSDGVGSNLSGGCGGGVGSGWAETGLS